MNAKDLDNINWILMNGQTHERIHLLSLISQIIKLTSNAKANINDESLTNDVHTVATLQQATPGNSQSNVNDASSAPRFRERKRRRTEHSQHNRTAPALQDSEFDLNETHTLEIGDTSDQIQEQHGQTTPRLEDRQTISELESDQAQTIEIVDISHEITQGSSKYGTNSFNLNKLLQSDVCADVMAYHEEHKCFSDDVRLDFMRILCKELMKGPRVGNATINKISTDVCLVFLKEDKMNYYDQQPNSTPTGTFYNMYRNKLKNQDPQSKTRKRKAKKNSPTNDETVDFDSNSKDFKF